jgi:hypothetical protein
VAGGAGKDSMKKKHIFANDRPLSPASNGLLQVFQNRFIGYALLLSLLFATTHLFNFRIYTGILSGTFAFDQLHQFYGALYLLLYTLFVVLVPVLVLSDLLMAGVAYLGARKK